MNNTRAKPRRDPVTGKAHIINWEHPAFGYRRCCSYCYFPLGKDLPEEQAESCLHCRTSFDHTQDDPMDDPDAYD